MLASCVTRDAFTLSRAISAVEQALLGVLTKPSSFRFYSPKWLNSLLVVKWKRQVLELTVLAHRK